MIKYSLAVLICINQLFTVAFAGESSEQQPQVEVNQEIVEKIYKNALKQSEIDSKIGKSGFNVVTGGDLFQPTAMKLSNNYYDVSYADNWNSIPMLGIQVENSFFESSETAIKWTSGFSYSYLEKIVQVTSKKSNINSTRTTNLRVHSIPLSAGLELEYKHWLDFTPAIISKVGAQWVYQSGTLDGLEQGFWVPFYQIGLGLTLFEPYRESDQSWFGGIKIAVTNYRSISSSQTIEGLSTNLGVVLRL